jgi:hypothetical protein
MRASNLVILNETLTKEIEVLHAPVCDGYSVFRTTQREVSKRPGKPDRELSLVDEGLATTENLEQLIANEPFESVNLGKVLIIPAAWRELIATEGTDLHNLWRLHKDDGLPMLPQWKQDFDADGNATDGVYTSYLAGEWGGDDIILRRDGPLPYRRTDGRPLPVVVSPDYQGRFNRNQYKLETAAQHLTSRPDVVAYTGEPRYGMPEDPQRIRPVGGELSFAWRMSEEDALAVDAAMETKAHFQATEFWRAVFDLDLLGLRAAGAARSDDFADGLDDDEDEDEPVSTPGW